MMSVSVATQSARPFQRAKSDVLLLSKRLYVISVQSGAQLDWPLGRRSSSQVPAGNPVFLS